MAIARGEVAKEPAIEELCSKPLSGGALSFEEALLLSEVEGPAIFELLSFANRARLKYKGNKVNLCSIINAKSGNCSEDCAFCAQSANHGADVPVYPLVEAQDIIGAARKAEGWRAHRFGIVTSGKGFRRGRDLLKLLSAIEAARSKLDIYIDASLGILRKDIARDLKMAGLQGYHHNLETARSFFGKICTTHSFADRLRSVEIAKEEGFYVCSGGVFGLGESRRQRMELAFELKRLDVDSAPLNFLIPIKGTKLEDATPLHPMEILKIIALFRLILPSKDIRVCGGREVNLRDAQSMIFYSGANGTMVGNYLTSKGREPAEDLRMIADLGLEV